jgi:hypothetical protein
MDALGNREDERMDLPISKPYGAAAPRSMTGVGDLTGHPG